ncbi:hypothetical protein LTR28_009167 [Elasticomyces elasticus]|nr:hypothetical protein LTR28_009167 [Elasticomyces elasticus]
MAGCGSWQGFSRILSTASSLQPKPLLSILGVADEKAIGAREVASSTNWRSNIPFLLEGIRNPMIMRLACAAELDNPIRLKLGKMIGERSASKGAPSVAGLVQEAAATLTHDDERAVPKLLLLV